jgi:hypothetical protein
VTDRILTKRDLNRALLARQLLLERRPLTITRALEHVAGLQAQDAQAPSIGLWTRIDGFRHEKLVRALRYRRVVKATLMRATLHLVSARDYAVFLPALLPSHREYWRSYLRDRGRIQNLEELARRALEYADQPRSAAEMRSLLGGDDAWWHVRFHVPFVHAPTGETWPFGRRPAFVASRHWLSSSLASTSEGIAALLRRYLAAFGPATVQDAATWSGLTVKAVREAADRLDSRLRRFRDERGRALLDLPRAPLPPADISPAPRLLPAFDNAILSHADRTRIITDEHRQAVIRGGIVDPIFLVEGFAAGVWRIERARGGATLVLEPFEGLPRAARRELVQEAERLVRFVEPDAPSHRVRL